jgi:hypothetical protein
VARIVAAYGRADAQSAEAQAERRGKKERDGTGK